MSSSKVRDLPALEKVIVEHGQYRDVSYIDTSGEVIETRCLVIPANVIESLI